MLLTKEQIKFKNSNLSIIILQKIFDDVEVNNNSITVDDEILTFNDKILIPYNKYSKKIKRKNKNLYEYLDFFDNKDHFNYLIDLFMKDTNNKLKISIEKLGESYFVILKDKKNFIYIKERFLDNKNSNVTNVIYKYYEEYCN